MSYPPEKTGLTPAQAPEPAEASAQHPPAYNAAEYGAVPTSYDEKSHYPPPPGPPPQQTQPAYDEQSEKPYYPPPPPGPPPQQAPTSYGEQSEIRPPQPPRPANPESEYAPTYNPAEYGITAPQTGDMAPPHTGDHARLSMQEQQPIESPIHYTRDPHRLTAYLVPFPKPSLKTLSTVDSIPTRLLIYTPPAPPLQPPAEGEKESKMHKVQRKWENEVREAKMNPQKVASWKGIKGRVTKGVDKAMAWTKSSNLEFLNRVPGAPSKDKHADDGKHEEEETKKTVGLEEMVLIYPASMPGTQEEIRKEFVENMLRTKSKAERDAIIATGLIPVTFGIDILATLIWPFGGLGEIDTVWAVANIRGAKTARSVTKRLNSTGTDSNAKLKLTFTPSPRLDVLAKYLATRCHEKDPKVFPSVGRPPTDSEALDAIGWSPSGQTTNWEDEQWELTEVKDDLRQVMGKGAKEWDKWVKMYEKDPEKAIKK